MDQIGERSEPVPARLPLDEMAYFVLMSLGHALFTAAAAALTMGIWIVLGDRDFPGGLVFVVVICASAAVVLYVRSARLRSRLAQPVAGADHFR